MPEYPFTFQNFLIKFAKFWANWIIPEKFESMKPLSVNITICNVSIANNICLKLHKMVCQLLYRQDCLSFIRTYFLVWGGWFDIVETFHWTSITSVVCLKFLLKYKIQHYLFLGFLLSIGTRLSFLMTP